MSEQLIGLMDFHFLRPLWLLALLLLPLVVLAARRISDQHSSWAQAIDSNLLKHLLQNPPSKHSHLPLGLLVTALAVGMIALAGPAWKKAPQPVHKNEDALVIVMDLSLSMEATDIKPSRLIRARHKLLDILASRGDGQTALVVFAGAAHIVSPLSDDTGTIAAMVPALSPLIMPALGSRMTAGINLANELLKNAGVASGQILIISDGIASQDIDPLAALINDSAHQFSMLTTGTEEGGPIPLPERGFLKQGNQIVIAKTEPAFFAQLARETGMALKSIQPDDSDIQALLDKPVLNLEKKTRELTREFDQWQEEGPWLLLLLVPLVALGFRRGWLLGIVMMMVIQPGESWAFGWDDLWQKKDQQGLEAFNQGEHEKASQLFKDPLWKGSAKYRAGNYQSAAEDFATVENASGRYNQGNALAKAGRLDEAIQAYQQALELDSTLEEARFNLDLLERLKQNQQNQDNQQNDPSEDQQQNNNQQGQDSQQSTDSGQNESQPQQEGSQNPQDSGQENSPSEQDPTAQQKSGQEQPNQPPESENEQARPEAEESQADHNATGEKQTAEQPSQAPSAPQQQEQSVASQPENGDAGQSEEEQAIEQWLRRIPDNPGELLRRKFDYQYRQRRLDNQFLPQNEDQTLW